MIRFAVKKSPWWLWRTYLGWRARETQRDYQGVGAVLYTRGGGGGTRGGEVRRRGLEVLGVPVALSDGHGEAGSADFLQKSPLLHMSTYLKCGSQWSGFVPQRTFVKVQRCFFFCQYNWIGGGVGPVSGLW